MTTLPAIALVHARPYGVTLPCGEPNGIVGTHDDETTCEPCKRWLKTLPKAHGQYGLCASCAKVGRRVDATGRNYYGQPACASCAAASRPPPPADADEVMDGLMRLREEGRHPCRSCSVNTVREAGTRCAACREEMT